MEAALAMRRVPAGDRTAFLARWLDVQKAWHSELPAAPIYSNRYWDVCSPAIRGYEVAAHGGFGEALVYADWREK